MAPTPTIRMGYRPELDAIRAVAAAVVVLDHAYVPGFDGGGLGVDVFFALSGFLITTILIEELAERGTIRLGRFYARRARRLLPCLLAVVAFCVLTIQWLPAGTEAGIVPSLLYFTNWQRALVGDVGALGHTWSLSVEEQFYLVWPLAMLLLARLPRMSAAQLCAAVAICVGVVRQVGGFDMDRAYNGTDLRSDGLLWGAALAFALAAGWRPRIRAWVPILVLLVSFTRWVPVGRAERGIVAVSACALIAVCLAGVAALRARPLVWLGRRSYGLYLWHYPITLLVLDHHDGPGQRALVVVASVLAAWASYRWIEERWLYEPTRYTANHEEVPAALP